ncbi:SMI1/KNR4 family protein [Streptomyces xanthophaeus]|uniref:SMI1/KNR4 family protein n=1 Tax=Streptomyces xanthophaeus TaxID=67385 RepID=UPI0037230256
MRDEYLDKVIALLGDSSGGAADPDSWARLELDLGFAFPEDYKILLDSYAPVKLNGHLLLQHPATSRWNLGRYIHETCQAWSEIPWDEEVEGDPRQLLGLDEFEFGTERGLTPIASADSGQTVFLARYSGGRPLLIVEDGEGEFFAYNMSFSEWLYRYLIGEDMSGPNSSYLYPGPVKLESMPMTSDAQVAEWYGPEREM